MEKLAIKGVAVRPGVSKNGVNYTKEELMNFNLGGRPILKDHNSTVDNTVGKITESFTDDSGKVNYQGWIKDDGKGLLEKIEDGRICEVSIGGFCRKLVKENDDDEFVTAIGLEAMELSLTPTPAVAGTSLQLAIEHKGAICESFSDYTKEENIISERLQEVIDNKTITTEELKDKMEVVNMAEDANIKPVAEATKVVEPQSYKIDVDTSKIDEALSKMKELATLQEKIKTTPVKEEVKEPAMHGKIVKSEAVAEMKKDEAKYVVESTLSNNGFSLWQHPKADGSLL